MIIKTGFVSNSSSQSFYVFTKKEIKDKDIKNLLDNWNKCEYGKNTPKDVNKILSKLKPLTKDELYHTNKKYYNIKNKINMYMSDYTLSEERYCDLQLHRELIYNENFTEKFDYLYKFVIDSDYDYDRVSRGLFGRRLLYKSDNMFAISGQC